MAASSATMPAPAAKAGMNKLTIIALVIAVAALAFTFLKPAPAAQAPAEATAHVDPKPGPVVDVGQMTVNLADAGRFARVSFALVLTEGTVVGGHGGGEGGVEARFPLVKEALLFEFSKISADQLRAPGGLDAIANTLSERVRGLYEHGEVMRVVLTELLVQ